MERLTAIVRTIDYDLCALTGDYRGQTFGPYEAALAGMSRICAEIKMPIYGVLGNHDTVCMLPGLEEMGIRMLLNECETIERGHDGEKIAARPLSIPLNDDGAVHRLQVRLG